MVKIKKLIKEKKFRNAVIGAATGLALLGAGVGIGYGIWGKDKKESIEVKPISELVSTLYYPLEYTIFIGNNPYGARKNVIKLNATNGKEEITFSIYEQDPCKFAYLLDYLELTKRNNGFFGILDSLERNTGYPKDYRRALNLRIERSAEGKPVYILSGDDLIFYTVVDRR